MSSGCVITHGGAVRAGSVAVIHFAFNPGKHEILSQCWLNVGPASQTLDQH